MPQRGIERGSGSHYAQKWLVRIRRLLLGRPLAQAAQLHHRLPVALALPLFASDALSSVAYATEEILHVLAGYHLPNGERASTLYLLPVSAAIVGLMLLVAYAYRKAIYLYSSGGGSYTVARRNLGAIWGVVAGSALIMDYCLTVAVSSSAGMAALASYYKDLHPFKTELAIGLVVFMTLINLRGLKESGMVFALPALAFAGMLAALIIKGLMNIAAGSAVPVPVNIEAEYAVHPFGWLVLIWAFSSGCSALTGVEAVSNGVATFKPPETKNAALTLTILISTLIVLFLGVGYLAHSYHVIPSPTETVIAQLAKGVFGEGLMFALTIAATLSILLVASNTAFASMPQLLANMARDGFAPRSLTEMGDRLVYNRGIVGLTIVSCALIWLFDANVSSLIPLYAVGVFLCFTLAQAGIWVKVRKDGQGRGRVIGLILLTLGTAISATVCLLLAIGRFKDGAWLVVVCIPALVLLGYLIRRHYDWFRKRMMLMPKDINPLARQAEPLTIVLLVGGEINRGTLEGIEFARAVAEGKSNAIIRALHVEMDADRTPRLKKQWEELVLKHIKGKIKLDFTPSPYRWLILPILQYLDELEKERYGDQIIVVIPEFETGNWFTHFLHNATSWRLRQALMGRPHVTIVTTRYFLAEHPDEYLKPH